MNNDKEEIESKIDIYTEDNNICFIRGVYITELFNDIPDEVEKKVEEIEYIRLPDEFTDIYSWVKKTNLHCMYCCHPFSSIPVSIPIGINSNGVFKLEGVFCSFNCCMAFVNSSSKYMDNRWDIIEMVRLLYSKFYNKKVIKIFESPPNTNLKIFNGTLSIKDYREQILKLQENEDCTLCFNNEIEMKDLEQYLN